MQILAALKYIYDYFFPYHFVDWYNDASASALCTSCRNGNFVGRNFDWAYDDVDECVMRVISCRDGGHQAIQVGKDGKPVLDPKRCVGCHLCVQVCPAFAIVSSCRHAAVLL